MCVCVCVCVCVCDVCVCIVMISSYSLYYRGPPANERKSYSCNEDGGTHEYFIRTYINEQ